MTFRCKPVASILFGALCIAHPVLAQTSPAPAPAPVKPQPPVKKDKEPEPAPQPDTESAPVVRISAERPTNRIDRQVYDVKTDISSSNSTAADALNNVPSVSVTPDGSVTLRGNANVQIMIDGKPSAMMQGENRGAALQSMPAEDIESVEVINNPGAQFGNEGGGGPILNLVMRRNRRPGGFGAVNANAGTEGRYNAGLFGTYNTGRLGLQGGVNLRHDLIESTGETTRDRIDPASGVAARSTQSSRAQGKNDSANVNATLTYNLSDTDTVAANVMLMRRASDIESQAHYLNLGAGAIANADYLRTNVSESGNESYNLGASYERKGNTPGEKGRLDLRVSGANNDGESAYANRYTVRPAGARDTQGRQGNITKNRVVDLSGDYERPGERGLLKLGFKTARSTNNFDRLYTDIDPLTGLEHVNALRTNRFDLEETTGALYGSYELRLNEDWGVQAGMRAEYTNVEIAQRTAAIDADNHYVNYIPSLFVRHKATEDTTIRLSYSHRIRRPGANDLNPFVAYIDELNLSSGNPRLKPTESDSVELGIETRFGKVDTNLRAYARKESDLISERRSFVGENVVLTTRENAGSNRSGGLEFTVNGKLTPKLTLNTSGNLAYTEQTTLGWAAGETRRTGTSLSGRARVNYMLSAKDQFQLMVNAQGKTLLAQGYREPVTFAMFSYRRTLTPALTLVLNVQDVFSSNKMETVIDTDVLKETSIRRFNNRVVFLGLSYRLGGFAGGPGPGRPGPVMRPGPPPGAPMGPPGH